jgi:hypothetical protein
MGGRGGGVLLGGALFAVALPAAGQGSDAEAHIDFQPPSADSPFTRAEGPFQPYDAGFMAAARFLVDYAYRPLESEIDGVYPVEHAVLFHVGGAVAALDWLMLELNFPFAVHEAGDASGALPAGEAHVGDVRVGAFLRPYESKELDLSLGARLWAPTGQREAYLGGDDHFMRFELAPALAGDVDVVRYGCTLGLAPLFFAGRDGDRVAASCALQFKLAPFVAVGVEPHFALFSYPAAGQPSQHTPGLGDAEVLSQFEALGTASFSIADFRLALAGGFGLGDAPGTAAARALGWISYSPGPKRPPKERREKVRDQDRDGVPDTDDECPLEAGDKGRRGCTEPKDLDADGIIEGDACPEQPGARYLDALANGCPDGDGDGVADPADSCPVEPGVGGEECPKFARLEGDAFSFTQPLQFAAGSAALIPVMRPALMEVKHTLRANPGIAKVRVTLGAEAPELDEQRHAVLANLLLEVDLAADRHELTVAADVPPGTIRVTKIP